MNRNAIFIISYAYVVDDGELEKQCSGRNQNVGLIPLWLCWSVKCKHIVTCVNMLIHGQYGTLFTLY